MSRSTNKKLNLKYEFSLIMRGYRLMFKLCPMHMLMAFFKGIFQAIVPYFTLYTSTLIVNELMYTRDVNRLLKCVMITVIGLFVIYLIKLFLDYYEDVFDYKALRKLRQFYFKHQNRLQYGHLENPDTALLYNKIESAENATGSGLSRLNWYLSLILSGFTDIICSVAITLQLFISKPETVSGGILAFINSPLAIILIFAIITVNAYINSHASKTATYKIATAWESLAHSNILLDSFGDAWKYPDVHIFDMKKLILKEFATKTLKPKWMLDAEKISIKYNNIINISDTVMTVFLNAFVIAKAFAGAFPIGNFLIYRRSVTKFVDGISGLFSNFSLFVQNNRYLEILYSYLDLPDEMYHGTLSVEKRNDNRYEIEFRNVSFRYPNREEYALRNINLKFKVGDKMAIVGMNGSGKTTFIKLLCRLYDPTEGEILLNGINIKKYEYEEYLDIFSVVFQDYNLFSFTIAQNVACSEDYDKDKVESCLEKAGLGNYVASLEKGIETYIHRDYERDGVDVSGGEAQKIALSRALYKDSPFIILDEPTASLDPIAEADIYTRFNDIVEDKTALFISHRLSSCRFCKNIIVFHNGNIIQHGSHAELIADESGKYYELWMAQSKYYQ